MMGSLRIAAALASVLLLAAIGCHDRYDKDAIAKRVVGTWRSSSGRTVIFHEDRTYEIDTNPKLTGPWMIYNDLMLLQPGPQSPNGDPLLFKSSTDEKYLRAFGDHGTKYEPRDQPKDDDQVTVFQKLK